MSVTDQFCIFRFGKNFLDSFQAAPALRLTT